MKRLIEEYLPAMSFYRRGMTEKPGTTWSEDFIPEDHRPGIESVIKNMVDEGGTTVDYKHYDGTGSPYKKILGKFNPEPVMTEGGQPAVRIRDEFDTNATPQHLLGEIGKNIFRNPLRAGWKAAELGLKARTNLVHKQGQVMPGFDATIPVSPELYEQLSKKTPPLPTKTTGVTPSMQTLSNHLEKMPGSYTMKEGDYLNKVAQEYGMTMEELLALNKGISNPNLVPVGYELKVAG